LNTDFKFSKELVELRRAKVLELVAQAVPQTQKLGVSPATISLDMQYLRESAKSNIRNHIEERIPAQFEECQTGLKLILRKTYEIVEKTTKWINELKQQSQERSQPAKISGLEEKQEEDEEPTPTPTEPGEDLREE
jgi:hypothetical protein